MIYALVLLIVLAWSSAASAQAPDGRYRTTPKGTFGEAVNVLDFLPPDAYLRSIDGTITTATNTRPYWEKAVRAACTQVGVSKRVSSPSAYFPIDYLDLRKPPDGVGCDSLELVGTDTEGFRSNDGPTFVAVGDRVGTARSDALIYVRDLNAFHMKGFTVNGNNTKGDLVRIEHCNYCRYIGNSTYGVNGVPWTLASSTASTDLITLDSSSSSFANGDRVEFMPAVGGAVPAGLTASVGYFVRDKSGSTLKVAATPGGAAVDITANSTLGFMVHSRTITYASSAVNHTTNTWTITNHDITEGDRLEFRSSIAAAAGTGDGASLVIFGRPFWAINVVPGVSFQISVAPGGAVFDISTVGGAGQTVTRHAYSHLAGGGNLYLRVMGNRFNPDDVRGVKMTASNQGVSGGRFYGNNRGVFWDNDANVPVHFTGLNVLTENTFESGYGFPADGVVEVGDIFALGTEVRGNYFEATLPGPPSYTAVNVVGPQSAYTTWIENNRILGPGVAHVDSMCFRLGSLPLAGSVVNNFCRGVGTCYPATLDTSAASASSTVGSIVSGNSCSTGVVEGLPTPASQPSDSATARPVMQITHPLERKYHITGGGLVLPETHGTALTNVNFRDGVFWHLDAAWDIQTTSNAWEGQLGFLFASTTEDTIRAAAFDTYTGQNLKLRPNTTVPIFVDRTGVKRVMTRPGDVVGYVDRTGETAQIGATGIFGGNVTAGRYLVCGSLLITTAGSAGTADVTLTYTDAIGSTTQTVVTAQSLSAQGRANFCAPVWAAGGSDLSYAVPWTGATGSPVFSLGISVTLQ